MRQNIILEKSFNFSLQLISVYKEMARNKEFVLSKQLLRSATSVGANAEEAIAAQSRRDFISKMSIASKEARETRYWLRLFDKSQLVPGDYSKEIKEATEIINILTKIVKTSQGN